MSNSITHENQTIYFQSSEDMSSIDDGYVSFIMTSPPYWNLKDYQHKEQIGQEEYEHYLERMNLVWDECYRVSKENAIMAINIGNRRHKKRYLPIAMDIYKKMEDWKLLDVLIWYIPNALPQPNYYIEKLFDDKYEFVLIFGKNYKYDNTFNKIRVKQKYSKVDHRKNKYNPKGRCIGNVFRIPAYRPPNVRKMNYYVAAYPEELVYLVMSVYSNEGDSVLDPFLGSGTTLKVAKNLRRFGYGYEINSELKLNIVDKISEKWEAPDFSDLDIILSAKSTPIQNSKPRRPKKDEKIHKQNWF